MGRSWDTWEQKKGDLGVQAWICIDLGSILFTSLEAFCAPWTKIGVFVHACFQVTFLMIFRSESGRLGFQKQAFGVRRVAKTSFSLKFEF